MSDEHKAKRLEIAHVLFMDIVGYSKLLTDEQSEALQELNQIVRSTEAAREAEAAGALTVLPTGDGMALVFTGSVEEPVECALEISQALRAQPSLPVRMGIHSGPIHHVKDANGRENIAGIGINIAQRVMDCGDAGHILVSKRVADDLAQRRRWQPYIHELGDVEVKHGVVVSLVNLYAETIGNPTPPTRLGKARGSIPGSRVGTRKAISPLARAIFILAVLLLVLAIISVIFAPAIMRTLDQRRSATLPQPTATAPPSLAETIQSAVAKQITDELQGELSRKKKAAVQPPPTGSAIPEKSIAVLPFENLSDDKGAAYFADGIQDEILTQARRHRRFESHLAHFDCEVQEQAGRSKDGVAAAWRRDRSRRQCAEGGRQGARQRPAHRCAGRFTSLGQNLRPRSERCLCDPERGGAGNR